MISKKYFFLSVLSFVSMIASGQVKPAALSKDQVKAIKGVASDFFKSENYREALPRYRQLQEAEPDNVEFNYRAGVCCIKTNIIKRAAAGYLKNVVNKKDAPRDAHYYLGIALMYENEFIDAIDAFEKYKEQNKGKLNASFKTDLHVEWCRNAMDLMKKPVDVRFINLGKQVNSMYPDYRPITGANDSVIWFSSNRKGNMGGIVDGFGEYLTDIYVAVAGDTSWGKAKNAGTNLNTEGYNEVLYVTMNGDRMLTYNEGGDAGGDIYFSELKGKQWTKPVIGGDAFRTKEKEYGACMTQDMRTVYFSAELKGTKGGKDIWKIVKDTATGKWSDPVNLGDGINTKYDEINPWLFYDEKTLFFGSEGHNSMGGFDLYKSTLPDPRQGWSKAENLGYPVNSVFDDESISLNGNASAGYVAALRDEGVGENDIYKILFRKPLLNPQPVLVKIRSVNTSGLPAREAFCIVTVRATGELIGTFAINPTSGLVNLSLRPDTYRIKIRSQKMGMADDDITITGNEENAVKNLTYTLK